MGEGERLKKKKKKKKKKQGVRFDVDSHLAAVILRFATARSRYRPNDAHTLSMSFYNRENFLSAIMQ